MSRRICCALVAALAVVMLAGMAAAQDKPDRPGPPHGGPGPMMFQRLDANHDGQISADEIPEQAPDFVKEMLKKADKDGDKKVSQDELKAAFAAHRPGPPRGPEGRRPGPPSGPRGPQAHRGGPPRGPQAIRPGAPAGPRGPQAHRGGPPRGPQAHRPGPPRGPEGHGRHGEGHRGPDAHHRHGDGHRGDKCPGPECHKHHGDGHHGPSGFHRRPGPGGPSMAGPRRPGGPGFGRPGFGGPRPKMPDPKEVFKKLDKDSNGSLSEEEFTAGMKALHARMAGPGPKGRPGGPPFGPQAHRGPRPFGGPPRGPHAFGGPPRGPHPGMAIAMFKRADADKDGKLSKDEAPGPLKANFDKIDADKDGQLAPEELKKAGEAFHKRMAEQRAEGFRKMMAARFKAADANDDGKLSKDEAPGPLKANFDKIDADKDGQLTPEELKKAGEEFRKRIAAKRAEKGPAAKKPEKKPAEKPAKPEKKPVEKPPKPETEKPKEA